MKFKWRSVDPSHCSVDRFSSLSTRDVEKASTDSCPNWSAIKLLCRKRKPKCHRSRRKLVWSYSEYFGTEWKPDCWRFEFSCSRHHRFGRLFGSLPDVSCWLIVEVLHRHRAHGSQRLLLTFCHSGVQFEHSRCWHDWQCSVVSRLQGPSRQ